MFMAYQNGVQLPPLDTYGGKPEQQFSSGKPGVYQQFDGAGFHKNRISLAAAGKEADAHDPSWKWKKYNLIFILETRGRFKANLLL
jgi:hypothetical protein